MVKRKSFPYTHPAIYPYVCGMPPASMGHNVDILLLLYCYHRKWISFSVPYGYISIYPWNNSFARNSVSILKCWCFDKPLFYGSFHSFTVQGKYRLPAMQRKQEEIKIVCWLLRLCFVLYNTYTLFLKVLRIFGLLRWFSLFRALL